MKFGLLQKCKKIINKYPGAGKYIFDFLDDDMTPEAIKKKKHSIISGVNDNLTKLAQKVVKTAREIVDISREVFGCYIYKERDWSFSIRN